MTDSSRTVTVERKVLARNDEIAESNRNWLKQRGIASINVISSPGAGKTTLLEKTLEALAGEIKCAVIVGDMQTDNDAKRLAGKGAPVRQIETVNSCHLSAAQIEPLLPEIADNVSLLIIENVGNLICPAAYDLGEGCKISLLSVTEGEDKPEKYPVIFSRSKAALITKIDLLPHLQWDRERCLKSLASAAPKTEIIEVSARTGQGFEQWLDFLRGLVAETVNHG